MAVADALRIVWHDHTFRLPYFYREGAGGHAILFVHGLGGAKENFYWALQSSALADCTLVMFDLPGTGLAEFVPTIELDVFAVSEIAEMVAAASAGAALAGGSEHGRLDLAVAIPSIGCRKCVELDSSRSVGDQMIAQNMALNLDIRAYHAYSFETVKQSDSGRLLQEFLLLQLPRLFLYGERNNTLSYSPELRSRTV